jgi:hypothetical protein
MNIFTEIIFLTSLINLNQYQDPASGARQDYSDIIFDSRIHTIQIYKEGWNLSYPVMKLNSTDKLVLNFDLLADDPETYYYSFVHCNRDWKESGVFNSEFMEGFSENPIEDYKPSFNTKVNYYHYRLSFPNERVTLKLSGNYIIKVYPAGEPDKPVFIKRFMVTEDAATIEASAHRPQLTEFYNSGQQVDFKVNYSGLNVNDPYRDLSCNVLQNGQWTNAKIDIKPDFVGNNELVYNSLSAKNIFPGGNEFRYFDIKSIRYQSEYIRKIDFVGSQYHVFLLPSENREFKPYFFWQDFNGKYYVAVQEGREMDTDADYLYVYFTLPSKYQAEGGSMYVAGALNNWSFNKENIMVYDPNSAQYQATLLLKQGWYNYEYIFVKDGVKNFEPSKFEGNHYETENDYLILVYYRNPRQRYDRLVGSVITNSNRKTNN